MNRPTTIALRLGLILATGMITSACIGDRSGVLGFATKRSMMAHSEATDSDITGAATTRPSAGRPVAGSTLNPPPSHVEIRAACWREFENAAADLDAKTALTQACVDRRTRR